MLITTIHASQIAKVGHDHLDPIQLDMRLKCPRCGEHPTYFGMITLPVDDEPEPKRELLHDVTAPYWGHWCIDLEREHGVVGLERPLVLSFEEDRDHIDTEIEKWHRRPS